MDASSERRPSGSVSRGRDTWYWLAGGFSLLWQAYRHSQDLSDDLWQYAVLVSTLEAHGLSRSNLEDLVANGYLAHAVECTQVDDHRRRFLSAPLTFNRRLCFVLTEAGAALAQEILGGMKSGQSGTSDRFLETGSGSGRPELGRPRWDKRHRLLWVGPTVVKRFRRPAPNQEQILRAFEEEQWPSRIDDPLPVAPDIVAQDRLHDAIKCLNRGLNPPLIHFRGDGTGTGVLWEYVLPAGPEDDF